MFFSIPLEIVVIGVDSIAQSLGCNVIVSKSCRVELLECGALVTCESCLLDLLVTYSNVLVDLILSFLLRRNWVVVFLLLVMLCLILLSFSGS